MKKPKPKPKPKPSKKDVPDLMVGDIYIDVTGYQTFVFDEEKKEMVAHQESKKG